MENLLIIAGDEGYGGAGTYGLLNLRLKTGAGLVKLLTRECLMSLQVLLLEILKSWYLGQIMLKT